MLVAVIACGLPKMAVVAGIVFFWLIYLISCWYRNSSLSCWFSALADEVPTYQLRVQNYEFFDLGHPSSYCYISWIEVPSFVMPARFVKLIVFIVVWLHFVDTDYLVN